MTVPMILKIDDYVNVQPGQPYRLLPFGKIVRGNEVHDITYEMAKRFRLPTFKPPIKLGSHKEETPAGGHIVALEVREDGLYAIPELNEQGSAAIAAGAWRYHSPEIIWDGGAIEDATTGEWIVGPLIVGDALLHSPALGEAAALYEYRLEDNDMTDNVSIPQSLWDKLMGQFNFGQPQAPEPGRNNEPARNSESTIPVEYATAIKERDDLKARLDQLEAESKRKETLATLVGQLQKKEDYGSMYVELRTAEEAAGMLATMSVEQRDWVMRNFKALHAQIDEAGLFQEQGSSGAGSSNNPMLAFDEAVRAHMTATKLDYALAAQYVAGAQPDLYKAYVKATKNKE